MCKQNVKNRLALMLVAHQPYTRCIENAASVWYDTLFPAITATYIPLLQMMDNLKRDGIPFCFSLVISPTLCALLDDPAVQEEYVLWLERLIDLGEREIERTKNDPQTAALAQIYTAQLKQKKDFFTDTCSGLLLPVFAAFEASGHIELTVTAASFCFLPHYRNLPEIIDAQIEAGILSHHSYFDSAPAGFWLPLMGYTSGIERNIRRYGLSYTVLDSHGFLFSDPLPQKGIFAPACHSCGCTFFGRDPETPSDIHTKFAPNPAYRNQNRDIGFEIPLEELNVFLHGRKERCATGFKYWSQKGKKTAYSAAAALKQAKTDAEAFLNVKSARFARACEQLNEQGLSLVCALDARDLGQNWYEGIVWLEQVFRLAAAHPDIECSCCRKIFSGTGVLQKINPFMSASEGSGYGENLLDVSNRKMFKYAYKAAERMIDLADRFSADRGLKERCLNLAAKQLLIAQSSDWPRMIQAGLNSEDAERIFKAAVVGFSTVYDALGSNYISTEWLTYTEKYYPLFPWINYRIFGKKH